MKLTVTINGKAVEIDMSGNENLLDLLRNEGYFGVKRGCENGDCGSCAVLVDGRAMCSCLMMAGQVQGRELVTCEGLGDPVNPHPLQETFVECGAAQCGFCIPGMIVSAKELIDDHPEPTFDQMKEVLDGNLCRCTGYTKQFEAVRDAAVVMARTIKARPTSGVKGLARPVKMPPPARVAAAAAKQPARPALARARQAVKSAVKSAVRGAVKKAKKAVKAVKKLAPRAAVKPAAKTAAKTPSRNRMARNKKGGRR